MKKIIPIIVVGALVLSGIGAIAFEADENPTRLTKTNFSVSEPIFSSSENYILVDLAEETSVRMDGGKPILPVITKTFGYKPGTEIINVDVNFNTREYKLPAKILPAPEPVPLLDTYASKTATKVVMNAKAYSSDELYPVDSYTVEYPFGMYKGERSQMVNIRINAQYIAAENILIVPVGEIEINIAYIEPDPQPLNADAYDMLIIGPSEFETNLQPLIDHKNNNGILTEFMAVEDIYSTYDGRNDPEDIKLCIKDAIEENDIEYVLLAGGVKEQKYLEWWVPEFRNNNDDGWESGFASDLYYADIYKNAGADFEDWDSNENEIFGEWGAEVGHKDIMDFYPDVTVARIPFHYEFELDIVVDKIITYENEADDSWFKEAVVIAGDTFPNGNTYYEGEMETGHTSDMLEADGFTVEKLWTSLETLSGVSDVVPAIRRGAGFVHFAGHGNPSTWSTHPPDDEETWITGLSWTDMFKLRNRGKLPFVLVGGCHNAQFNASLGHMVHGIKESGIREYFDMDPSDDGPNDDGTFGKFWLKEWVPRDFCSWLLLKKNGGSIGSIGMTGLGYGYVDQHAGEGLGGWIEPRMFQAYAEQDIHIMGKAHDQAITDYINIIGFVNEDQIDRKTIEAFALLGDPSLKLGGI